jgi:prepilin-type processing-associated H-X9-DG protein
MLLPALAKAKESAKKTKCISNLKNIGLAMVMYAGDNDDYIPRANTNNQGTSWMTQFMPYLPEGGDENDFRNKQIYKCPSYPDKEAVIGFAINGFRFSSPEDTQGGGGGNNGPSKLTAVTHPAATIYMTDTADPRNNRAAIYGYNDPILTRYDVWAAEHLPYIVLRGGSVRLPSEERRVAVERHGNNVNGLYMDGHVETIATDQMTVDMWRTEKY